LGWTTADVCYFLEFPANLFFTAEPIAGRGWGIRHVQAAVMAIAAFMGFALRINLSIAVVAMVRYKDDTNNITGSGSSLAPVSISKKLLFPYTSASTQSGLLCCCYQ